jgi:ribonuclease HI
LAKALRHELRSHWDLPTEEVFRFNGDEWFFLLLSNVSEQMRTKIIFMLWRVWHHRNNIVHGDGKARVSASVPYLCSYITSYAAATGAGWEVKGKAPAEPERLANTDGAHTVSGWLVPTEGELKANVDAAWDSTTRRGGIGVVVRDHQGKPVLTDWRFIPGCAGAEDAEALACLEGLKHLIALNGRSSVLESDCLRAVQVLTCNDMDKSNSWCIYSESRELLKVFSSIRIAKVDRMCNSVAHSLAQLGKSGTSGYLLGSAPTCVLEGIKKDCNLALPD